MPDATVLLLGRRRSGKCLLKGETVLMYDGSIKKVEDIRIGELVMGDDSTPRTVLETHSGTDTMYKITNHKGESYTVNSHHILSLVYTGKKNIRDRQEKNSYQITWFDKMKYKLSYKTFSYKNKNKEDVYIQAKDFLDNLTDNTTVDIPIQDFLKLSKKYRNNLLGYQVPIQFPTQNVPIDPYIIGYWLGDGNSKELDTNILINLKLNQSKHIPMIYKCNSRENRLRLLAGLIDSISKNKKFEINLCKSNEQFIDDIIYLVYSLGFVATRNMKQTKNKEVVQIQISGERLDEVPTQIIRTYKKDNLLSPINVKKVGEGEYYGIELDGNNRFVLGNFIVTHNSWLVRDIFYHHRHIPSGVIFSGTEEASPFFGDFVPDCFIHSEYDPLLVESIMTRQKRKIREAKQSGKSETGKLPGNNMFIVLDDMLHDAQNWKKEKTIKNIFFNGRHYNFLFILTMQYPLGITPELRSNIDYVFVFNEPSVKNRKKIYDDYAGMIPSFDHFCNILDSCTQNHECLVIKTSGNSSDYKDQIFWYKSEAHNNFRVGHPKFWKYHNNNYNSNYEEDNEEDEEHLQQLKKKFAKTRKLKVIVSRQGDIVGYKHDDD